MKRSEFNALAAAHEQTHRTVSELSTRVYQEQACREMLKATGDQFPFCVTIRIEPNSFRQLQFRGDAALEAHFREFLTRVLRTLENRWEPET